MKICYISTKSIHTRRWIEYFAERGHEVHLITQEYDNYQGVKIHVVNPKASKLSPFFKAIIIRNLVKKIKPDILHAHQVVPFGLYGALSGFHPFVVSAWGSDIAVFPEKSKIHRFLVEYVLKKADAVSASAEDKVWKNRLMELKCSKNKIAQLRLASVDTKKFHPSKRSESLRKTIGAENDFLILSARWFKPVYHIDVFIKAIPYVLEKMSNAKFIIIGSGYLEDKLKDISKELKVEKNVLFVGKVPHEDMPKYLASADLYVDTFVNVVNNKVIDKGNGIGVVTLEAMACATPQILPDRIEVKSGDLYQGLTYRPLEYQDLADKIIELLQNEKLRKQIGNKSRNAAIKIVDENVVMRKWEELYFNLQEEI